VALTRERALRWRASTVNASFVLCLAGAAIGVGGCGTASPASSARVPAEASTPSTPEGDAGDGCTFGGFVGCDDDGSIGDSPPAPAVPTLCAHTAADDDAVASVVGSEIAFAIAAYRPIAASAPPGSNLVFSPSSLTTALEMVSAGAAGNTLAQLEAALSSTIAPETFASRDALLACEDNGVAVNGQTLATASAVWAQAGEAFVPKFTATLEGSFGAPLQQADFARDPAGAAAAIDQWASMKTGGEIPALLAAGDVAATTKLAVVSALDFHGGWAVPFPSRATSPAAFTLPSGETVMVPTMHGSISGLSRQSTDAALYEIPYDGYELVMDIIVPNSFADYEANLSPGALVALFPEATDAEGGTNIDASIPKLAFATHVDLAPALASLGVTDAFDPTLADFSAVDGARDLVLGSVVAGSTLAVDEQGTTATATASATSNEQLLSTLTADHPFLFLVRDAFNGHVLFFGRVEDPRQAGP
jgi:serpin B